MIPFYPKNSNNFGANINLEIYATEINAFPDNRKLQCISNLKKEYPRVIKLQQPPTANLFQMYV